MIRLLTFMTCMAVFMTLLIMSLTESPILNDLAIPAPDTQNRDSVVVLCAASNRDVMEAIVKDYRQICDDKIELRFGPSQSLASGLEVSSSGDIFISADDSCLTGLIRKRLVMEVVPIARMKVVVAVQPGNPLGINSLDDLLRNEVRLIQADPELAAVGKLTKEALEELSRWESIADATESFVSTVTEAGNSLLVGAADAVIVYDVTALAHPDKMEIVSIPEFEDLYANVSISMTRFGKGRSSVQQFYHFISTPEWGQQRYLQLGFSPPFQIWNEGYDP